MKLLVDMNLGTGWAPILRDAGWETLFWRDVGAAAAPDDLIATWAIDHGYVVITQDLGFVTIVREAQRNLSVVLVRARKSALPVHFANILVPSLRRYATQLEIGAILVVDERRQRIRMLPLE